MEVAEILAKFSTVTQNEIVNWLNHNAISWQNHSKTRIPLVFKQLCFYHYTNKCTLEMYTCSRKHFVATEIGCEIKSLQFDQLMDAYKYAKERCKLYQETVFYFLEAFEKKNDAPQLIRCIEDIPNNIFNKTPFVEQILIHLCNLGTSFSDAVNKIIEEYNSKNTYISEILLNIICLRRKEDICENWHLVQKLTKNRGELIDHGLVEEIVKMCCEFNNVRLAKHIVQDFIKPLAVNFEMVNSDILQRFLSMLQFHNLEQEKRVVLNKIDTCNSNQSSMSPISGENVDENNQTNTFSADNGYSKLNSEAKHSNSQSNGLKDASTLIELNPEDIVSEEGFTTDESSTTFQVSHFSNSDKAKFNSEAKHSNSQSNGLKDTSTLIELNLEDIVSEEGFTTDESSTTFQVSHFNNSDKDIVNVTTSPEKFDLPQKYNEMETENSDTHRNTVSTSSGTFHVLPI